MKKGKYSPYAPINFFFHYDDKSKLHYMLNGCHFPDRKTLMGMFGILSDLLLVPDKIIAKKNIEITERQKKEALEQMEENRMENRKGREPEEGYIYLIKSLNLYKIGRCKSPDRIKTYRTENPHKIDLIFQIKVSDYIGIERMLLKKFAKKQYKGEWFILDEKDILEIQKILL